MKLHERQGYRQAGDDVERYCLGCKTWKLVAEFHSAGNGLYKSRCKLCVRASDREARLKNPELFRQRKRNAYIPSSVASNIVPPTKAPKIHAGLWERAMRTMSYVNPCYQHSLMMSLTRPASQTAEKRYLRRGCI